MGAKKERTLATPIGAEAPSTRPKRNSGTDSSTTIVRENTEKSTENVKKVEKSSRKSLDVDSEGRELTKEPPPTLCHIYGTFYID